MLLLRTQYLHGDPWKARWFVLQEGKLYYYLTEEEWKTGKPPRNADNPILMGSYEVMVNPKDFDWGFMLESVGQQDRDWELRANSETLRLAWIKVLLNMRVRVANGWLLRIALCICSMSLGFGHFQIL